MKYKTVIEVITDADDADEAVDKAGEYLRGTYNSHVPLKVRTQLLNKRNYKALGYAIAICILIPSLSFMWFSAGRTYQKITSTKQKALETYAVHPPLSTDVNNQAGEDFKKSWDKLYKEKVLHSPDEDIKSE